MTDVYTAALLPTKPLSDDDPGVKHGFGAEASLPLTLSAPAVTRDTTRLFFLVLLRFMAHQHCGLFNAKSYLYMCGSAWFVSEYLMGNVIFKPVRAHLLENV